MNIVMLGDRILIEPIKAEDKTAGGIIIPDKAKEKPTRGKVIAAAKDLTVKEGQTIYYQQNAGTEMTVDGKKVLAIKESDILFIYEEDLANKMIG